MRVYFLLVFQAIASMEVLRDIAADVGLQGEFPTRVLIKELAHIENQLIKNNQLLTFSHLAVELF